MLPSIVEWTAGILAAGIVAAMIVLAAASAAFWSLRFKVRRRLEPFMLAAGNPRPSALAATSCQAPGGQPAQAAARAERCP